MVRAGPSDGNSYYRHLRRVFSHLMANGRESLSILPPVNENGTVIVSAGVSIQNTLSLDYKTGEASFLVWDQLVKIENHCSSD